MISDDTNSKVEAGHDILDWLLGSSIPTKAQNFLKEHSDEKIDSLAIGRTPINKTLDLALDIMSGGKLGQIKKQLEYDKFFHLYIIVNKKWVFEKNELYNIKPYHPAKDEEVLEVPLKKDLTIGELFKNASEGNEKAFWREYSPFTKNCQYSVIQILKKNGLMKSEYTDFIKQPLEEFLKEMHPTTELARKITNVGAIINRLLQYMSGGKYSISLAVGTEELRPIRKRRVKRGQVRRFL